MDHSDVAVIKQHLIDPEICIRCNTCEETCPSDAISHDSRNYVVDAAKCNACLACIGPCPTGAIDNWRIVARAAAHGIPVRRLELLGYGSHVDALAAYADVDIALDPFPFSGCATSCDALWMGVPVVTRIGDTMVSRQTASLLTSLDLNDLIARDNDSYVRCVLELANAAERRRALRSGLRERVQLTIANVERHAHDLSGAIREAWRAWCDGESARAREDRA